MALMFPRIVSLLLLFTLPGILLAVVIFLLWLYLCKKAAGQKAEHPSQEAIEDTAPLTGKEPVSVSRSLGEALRENRLRCGMTQETVAESLQVSRQAVSKWENGTSDPTTGNLLALAKLYGVSAEELLRAAAEE